MRITHFKDEHVRRELLEIIKQFAYSRRDVTLNSGAKSNFYIDCKQVSMRPEGAFVLGWLFFEGLSRIERDYGILFDVCGGMAMGALPLSMALSLHAFGETRFIPSISVRKDAKDHGTKQLIEGPVASLAGKRILIVEDVVTTGRATLQAVSTLREAGFSVEHVLAIVDREAGGEANLNKEGLTLHTLFNLSDFDGASS